MRHRELPLPPHYASDHVGEVWRVPYQERALQAENWASEHDIAVASEDRHRTALLAVDVQNTFCIPGFELFVGGRTGAAAVEDNRRLCEFIYRNMGSITQVLPTMDTHQAMQIFHAIYLVDSGGRHPEPFTLESVDDLEAGRWTFNPRIAAGLGMTQEFGQQHLLHYVATLKNSGKYELTVWPYHSLLGGIGHALVSAVEEAIFFHGVARSSAPDFQIKGDNPLTEHYSVLGPEVMVGPEGGPIAQKNLPLIKTLLEFDTIVIAGQAKSHCVAWTIDDLLGDILIHDRKLAERVYLLEDCTSPVVVPDVIDYTEQADAAFERFAEAGMHVVRSTEPLDAWPGVLGNR